MTSPLKVDLIIHCIADQYGSRRSVYTRFLLQFFSFFCDFFPPPFAPPATRPQKTDYFVGVSAKTESKGAT